MRQLYQQENTDEAFVQKAIQVLNSTGARDFATERATYYSQTALQHLEEAQPAGPAFAALNQLSAMLLNRDF